MILNPDNLGENVAKEHLKEDSKELLEECWWVLFSAENNVWRFIVTIFMEIKYRCL